MSHELDHVGIENIIRRAKQQRADHMAEALGPALRGLGGFALLAVLMPWHLVRQTLTGIFS
jgi:hypothetical protein